MFIFILTAGTPDGIVLNVFNSATTKGKTSKAQLLNISLDLFRQDGFDNTTMRDIAKAANMSLGAFYYYYPSKDSIVLDFYRQVQDEHVAMVAAGMGKKATLRERLGLLMHTKLDILSGSRNLMGSLLRYTGHPDHPLSFLGESTSRIREESMAMFADALREEKLPDDMAESLPMLLWSTQMGILLFLLYDKSPNHERTRKLADVGLDLTVRMIKVARIPVFRPVRKMLRELLVQAEFITNQNHRAAQLAVQE